MTLPSIHRRRLPFYLLWSFLLAASLGSFALWTWGGRREQAQVRMDLSLAGLPAGTRARLHTGRGASQGPWHRTWEMAPGDGQTFKSTTAQLDLAWRPWGQQINLDRSDVRLAVEVVAPGEAPRWWVQDLRTDLHNGVYRKGRTVILQVSMDWNNFPPRE